ncbi:hypothetical protein KDD30_20520 (plasmid) [Photobacterium sp. GJ3]|uniref:hypothetical protein n=1 Tax=Photobacterium sp. GJ3 TaxID=2829502 RepID=UPI001B8B392A|nr:hypothetical protein [Photobacterium sp. GJ3]QUJ70479.1 hypothetical protein KDD30_20520 [Photobacterium sp. GJ3]
MSENKIAKERLALWDWVKAISTIMVVGVISYKVYLTPINLTVDFPTLLSLLLALFSVGLAALFYFKATETSNTFYDNTYNFTKDIAQLLIKIESGFGEKLRNLDEGYAAMRSQLQSAPYQNGETEETKQKIKGEKEEIEKVIEERNQIVSNLIERSQLEKEEKENILSALAEKERELESLQRELNKMNKRLFIDRLKNRENRDDFDSSLERYTFHRIIKGIGIERVFHLSPIGLKKKIDEMLSDVPHQYLDDLERHGYFDNGITRDGVEFIRDLARKNASQSKPV